MGKKKLSEMVSAVATNNAGSGKIDGIGVGEKGEPGVRKKKPLRAVIKRRPPNG